MSLGLSKMRERIASVWDVGKYIVTNAKQDGSLHALINVAKFMDGFGTKDGRFGSLR